MADTLSPPSLNHDHRKKQSSCQHVEQRTATINPASHGHHEHAPDDSLWFKPMEYVIGTLGGCIAVGIETVARISIGRWLPSAPTPPQ